MRTGRATCVGPFGSSIVFRFGWRRLVVVLIPSVLLAAVLGAGQARAQLPSNCSRSGSTVSCTFSSTGAEQTFSVPAGISSVQIEAVGAPGSFFGPGLGAVATGTVSVTGGETLYIEVGGAGGPCCTGSGGFNGGGDGTGGFPLPGQGGGAGGGGGGASDVRTAPLSAGLNPDTRLLIAGGGGGNGAPGEDRQPVGGLGGSAGASGSSGKSAVAGVGGGGGGQPGSASGGGAGGGAATCRVACIAAKPGGDGALGQGGDGTVLAGFTAAAGGGGGGGGLYGGGGGAGGAVDDQSFNSAQGGGGGGGSSLVPAGGSVVANTNALRPQVTITYTVPGGPELSPPNGRIAFDSFRNGPDVDIWTMNPDGSDPLNLTAGSAAEDFAASWSPDGKRLVFLRAPAGSESPNATEIWLMRADGSGQAQLTDNAVQDDWPSWSPSGRRIVFQRDPDGEGPDDGELWVMRADGSGERQLTDNAVEDNEPAWSPNGRRIAFSRDSDPDPDAADFEIFDVRPDGSRARRLTDADGFDGGPDYSPDGRRIAFDSERDGDPDVFVMERDGDDPTQLTGEDPAEDAVDILTAYSPDGRFLAFETDRDSTAGVENVEVYVMRADGTEETNLTNDPAFDGSPDWQPLVDEDDDDDDGDDDD
jgi:Tol biopolymer transport system component